MRQNTGTTDTELSLSTHSYKEEREDEKNQYEMAIKLWAILMTIIWLDSTMQQIYGAHITEIIVDEEPMPAGFSGSGGGGARNDAIAATRDDTVYIISGSSNNLAARATSSGNGNGAATAAAVVNNNNNLQNAPFGMVPPQMCTIEIPVVKKYTGHCIRLGKKGKGCVAGEHIMPYHFDCL